MRAHIDGRLVDCDGEIIGVAGENKVETLVFEHEEDLGSASAKLVVYGSASYTAEIPLLVSGYTTSWLIEAQYLTHGDLTCQLVVTWSEYADPHVWMSKVFGLKVLPAATGAES